MPAEAKSHWYKSAVGALPWELRERCRKKVRLSPGSFSMWNCFVDCPDAGLENRISVFSFLFPAGKIMITEADPDFLIKI